MPTGAPSAQKIINAWNSVNDEWIARHNKAHDDGRQWEVVHTWHKRDLDGSKIIDDATMKVVARYSDKSAAHEKATDLEMLARAGAVQAMIVDWNK